jgi:hypothetical protein
VLAATWLGRAEQVADRATPARGAGSYDGDRGRPPGHGGGRVFRARRSRHQRHRVWNRRVRGADGPGSSPPHPCLPHAPVLARILGLHVRLRIAVTYALEWITRTSPPCATAYAIAAIAAITAFVAAIGVRTVVAARGRFLVESADGGRGEHPTLEATR